MEQILLMLLELKVHKKGMKSGNKDKKEETSQETGGGLMLKKAKGEREIGSDVYPQKSQLSPNSWHSFPAQSELLIFSENVSAVIQPWWNQSPLDFVKL